MSIVTNMSEQCDACKSHVTLSLAPFLSLSLFLFHTHTCNKQAAMSQAEARKTRPLPITAAHVEGQVSPSF